MKIIKYKKMSGNNYKVYFEDKSNIVLNENIILKYNLLIKKEIENLDAIMKDNNNYLIYDKVLKYINTKMRSESEIRTYLKKNEISEGESLEIIKKLKENNYINDELYVKSYISDKIRLNNDGPNKIKKDLSKLNIAHDIIDKELENIDYDLVISNIQKLVDKKIKTNRSYAGDVLKNKILNDLINKGYNREDVVNILNKKDLGNDELYDKEYNKLYNKYKDKYSNSELEYFIKQKLYKKGLKK